MKYIKLALGANAIMAAGMLAVHADKGAGPEAGVAAIILLLLGWFLLSLTIGDE